jgi:hypothetical protein
MEDMLRACVLTYEKDWEQSLPYAEFSYNNSYQASLGISPFEALYGRKCKTPLMWSEVGERALVGPALIKEAEEKVAEIREKLKAAQSRQKNYADKRRREIGFNPGDFVYLKVSPIRGMRRFQVQGKLAPRYIGPYRVLKRVGAVAYRLGLPEEMSDIHPVFHVSQLRRCLRVPEGEYVPVETIDLQPDPRRSPAPPSPATTTPPPLGAYKGTLACLQARHSHSPPHGLTSPSPAPPHRAALRCRLRSRGRAPSLHLGPR